MKKELGLNPWLTIWVKPRKTIRAIIDSDVNHGLIFLSAIYGFQYLLQVAQFLSTGRDTSLWITLSLALVLSIPMGYLLFNAGSFFLFLLGKLIKGKGSFKEVRAATFWSTVPMIVSVAMWIILLITHGNSLFVVGYERGLTQVGMGVNIVTAIIQLVVAVWAFIIFLHALGEVQGFSAWMALLNTVLSGIAMSVLLFLVCWGVSALTHMS
ncbi:MAG: hypothetical protein K1060chlam2_01407 [Chlamydiae bacterium]|nr:hypothetical protein [Chlamydiota bacterium]